MKIATRNDALLLVSLLVVAGGLSVLLGQDANWDLLNYHLYNAYAFFNQRYTQDVGVALQWYFNPTLDMPYYVLVRIFNGYPRLVAFLQGAQAGLVWFLLWKLFALAKRVFALPLWLAVAAWAVGCSGSALISEVGTTFNDIPVTALVLAGSWMICGYCQGESGSSALSFGFLLLGAAVGFKLTSAIYLVAAGLALLATKRSLHGFARATMFGAIGFAITGGAWAIYMQASYGNPFFPYFNSIFHSPWWSQSPVMDERFMPRSPWQWILYPAWWVLPNREVVTEVSFADARMLVGTLCAVLLLCTAFMRTQACAGDVHSANAQRPLVLFLAVFYLLSYLLWLLAFSIYRYAMPLEVLAPLLLIALIAWLAPAGSARSGAFGMPQVMAAVVLLGVAVFTRYPDWMRVGYSERVIDIRADRDLSNAVIIGLQGDPPVSYLATGLDDRTRFLLIGGGDMKQSWLHARQGMAVREARALYVVMRKDRDSPLLEYVRGYWGLEKSGEPCGTVHTNINGDWQLCKVLRTAR